MGLINLAEGWSGERVVSNFAQSIFDFQLEKAKEELKINPSLVHDPDALEVAVHVGDIAFVKFLLKHGFRTSYNAYYGALSKDKEWIDTLKPKNLSLKSKIEKDWANWHLNLALLYSEGESVTIGYFEKLKSLGASFDEVTHINHSYVGLLPIHFLCMNGHSNLDIFKLIIENSRDVNALTPKGKTAQRMIYENPKLSKKQRSKRIEILNLHNAIPVPKLSLWEKLTFKSGSPVSSRE
ncbi:MAG: hypothetical protein K9K67_05970 [Bacteriovoracaceae bacterium]|nr:hypothetical protein [Bacteriovoracaceae bacterium]